MRPLFRRLTTSFLLVLCAGPPGTIASSQAQTDLDGLMRQVLAERDDNWKKLQQYVLDERELIELRGPGRSPVWGERREYTWFIRNGVFVRSPVKFNGVEIGETERRKYEEQYQQRVQRRERRAGNDAAPLDVDGILAQTRQPQFISSAYFLRFKFEEGKYAFVGRETLDGREVLRIEYYPEKLFSGTDRRRNGRDASERDKAYDAEFRRLMNKVALVTLWVEPAAHQIVRYTFSNVALDFLPLPWLVHVDDIKASMTMSQPFSDVWLPRDLDFNAALTLAPGQFDVHYGLEYHDYRRADVTTKVAIPKER